MNKESLRNPIRAALFGHAVGDALGVPVEFTPREELIQNPVTDMLGYGTYSVPPGTWSDDASLSFCLAEALTEPFSLNTIGNAFVRWAYENYWTPHGDVFDIGNTTSWAIQRLTLGIEPHLAGANDEASNGNGSLMRVLPLVFAIHDYSIEERFERISQVSSLTHGHIHSVVACFYYLEFARELLRHNDKFLAYQSLQKTVPAFLESQLQNTEVFYIFDRLFKDDISILDEAEIESSGYVLHTLEASIWCLLTTQSYESAVLKAVNLGKDTDTTAAVTGGLAGLLYGIDSIPLKWKTAIARHDDIEDLANRFWNNLQA